MTVNVALEKIKVLLMHPKNDSYPLCTLAITQLETKISMMDIGMWLKL